MRDRNLTGLQNSVGVNRLLKTPEPVLRQCIDSCQGKVPIGNLKKAWALQKQSVQDSISETLGVGAECQLGGRLHSTGIDVC